MREICDIGSDVVKCFSPRWPHHKIDLEFYYKIEKLNMLLKCEKREYLSVFYFCLILKEAYTVFDRPQICEFVKTQIAI